MDLHFKHYMMGTIGYQIDTRRGTRLVAPFEGRPKHQIEASDLARIQSPHGRLNGHLINGIATSLLNNFSQPSCTFSQSAGQCAVLTTYDLPRVRYRGSDEELWRQVSPTQYWVKRLWLIPIHRPKEEHWVLAVASISDQRLFFFDSFGDRHGWRLDLQVCVVFPCRKAPPSEIPPGCYATHNPDGHLSESE
jgi:hypothetical protein